MTDLDATIQAAVTGWLIPMLSIPEIYRAGEDAAAKGEDVTAAVTAVLERVATRV